MDFMITASVEIQIVIVMLVHSFSSFLFDMDKCGQLP